MSYAVSSTLFVSGGSLHCNYKQICRINSGLWRAICRCNFKAIHVCCCWVYLLNTVFHTNTIWFGGITLQQMIFFSILGLLTSITFFVIIQRDSLIVSSWLGVAFKTRPSVDANNLAIILLKITGYDDIITSYEVEIELIGAILSLALFSLIKPLYQRWKIVVPNWDKMIFLILSCLVSGLLGKF